MIDGASIFLGCLAAFEPSASLYTDDGRSKLLMRIAR
jgi:hypothetical protein